MGIICGNHLINSLLKEEAQCQENLSIEVVDRMSLERFSQKPTRSETRSAMNAVLATGEFRLRL